MASTPWEDSVLHGELPLELELELPLELELGLRLGCAGRVGQIPAAGGHVPPSVEDAGQ